MRIFPQRFAVLLPSRYCEVDQFGAIAHSQFGSTKPGWERAVAVRDWVHDKVTFNYNAARPTKTSADVEPRTNPICDLLIYFGSTILMFFLILR